jgi:hypothetical protein
MNGLIYTREFPCKFFHNNDDNSMRLHRTFTARLYGLTAIVVTLLGSQTMAGRENPASSNSEDPQAIQKVLAGTLSEANASWWGFNPKDSTEAIQAALDSGAEQVTVPYMGEPWIVRPLSLRGDQEVHFEAGVVVLAKKGSFLGRGDSLFTASAVENVVVKGYGATFRMRKTDYMAPPYEKAEWRMGLSLRGCRNLLIEGLRIESSGGDGIYIDGGGKKRFCEDVVIRNVTCYDNHRQGISVISAENLLIENCVFANTWGTAPGAGIDLEPDGDDQSLVNIVVRNCLFENNEGHEILVYPKNLREKAPNLSIRFENCLARKTLTSEKPDGVAQGIGRKDEGHGWSGISVAAVCDNGPGGYIEFVNCVVENSGKESVRIFDKSSHKAELRFVNCHFRNPWLTAHPEHWQPRVPIHLQIRRPHLSEDLGGILFDNCHVYDRVSRPAVLLDQVNSDHKLRKVTGTITVHGPGKPRMEIGIHAHRIALQLADAPEYKVLERKPNADAE